MDPDSLPLDLFVYASYGIAAFLLLAMVLWSTRRLLKSRAKLRILQHSRG